MMGGESGASLSELMNRLMHDTAYSNVPPTSPDFLASMQALVVCLKMDL